VRQRSAIRRCHLAGVGAWANRLQLGRV